MEKSIVNNRGQGLVEYALIIALIAIALVSSLELLQRALSNTFANTEASLAGGIIRPPI